jgi:hypothetical protein
MIAVKQKRILNMIYQPTNQPRSSTWRHHLLSAKPTTHPALAFRGALLDVLVETVNGRVDLVASGTRVVGRLLGGVGAVRLQLGIEFVS